MQVDSTITCILRYFQGVFATQGALGEVHILWWHLVWEA